MSLSIPGQMITESVPDIPQKIADRMYQYLRIRAANFCDWDPRDNGLLISTRFANTFQLHQVKKPGGTRRQLTFFKEPLYSGKFCPSPDHYGILFSMDTGGGEYYQIYYFDLNNGQKKLLTDGESKNGSPLWSNNGTNFAYSSTRRNGRDHDIHLTDIDSPDNTELICKVQGLWAPVAWAPDDKKLLLIDYISATESYYHILDIDTGNVEMLFPKGDETCAYGDAVWSKDGKGIYFIADEPAQEFMQLRYVDLESREVTNLTSDIPWNVTALSISKKGHQLAFITNEDGLSHLHLMDTTSHQRQQVDLPMGVFSCTPDYNADDTALAFSMNTPTSPSDIYTLKLEDMSLTQWTHSEVGGLNTSQFTTPELIRYPSFDDKMIPAFYFKPKQKSDKPYPVVIMIHGGPESQYRPGFSSVFQYWLNELDIAILAPNVRGSSGYGKTYIKIDNGYLREDSVKDIGALLDYIEEHPELDEKRVCVYGGSYGGYMVLASLTHYNARLKAGAEIVGISNFVTFLKNTNPYRRDLRRVEYGDERDPKMAEFLESISPTTNAHKITKPLLVAQGLNDPRVPASEAEQIVETVRKNQSDVWYILAKDEGHGFHKQINMDYYYSALSLFFEKYLLD